MEETLETTQEQPQEEVRPVGNFYLRFNSEEEFLSLCDQAGFMIEEVTEWETVTETVTTIDINGEEVQEEKESNVPKTIVKRLRQFDFGHSFDLVGKITKGGEYSYDEQTGESVEVTPPEEVPGYHVNYSGILPEQFDLFVIEVPSSPARGMRTNSVSADPVEPATDLTEA